MPTYLYFLLWGAFFFVMMRFGCGAHIMGHGHKHGRDSANTGASSSNDATNATASLEPQNDRHH